MRIIARACLPRGLLHLLGLLLLGPRGVCELIEISVRVVCRGQAISAKEDTRGAAATGGEALRDRRGHPGKVGAASGDDVCRSS